MDLTLLDTLKSKLGLAPSLKPALIGVAAIIVMVAVLAGRLLFDTATATEIQIEHDASAEVTASNDTAHAGESGAGEQGVVPQEVFVYVSGAVKAPGLVKLQAGDRLADAIQAAGGFADDAVPESVNLARQAVDGEQVHVPSVSSDSGAVAQAGIGAQPDAGVSAGGGKVNINTAGEQELETLPGVGPSTAQKIVADREASGPFSSVDDLTRVSGIGDKKLEALRDFACV